MWYTRTILLLVFYALTTGAEPIPVTTEPVPPVATTTRAPHRTLDRQADELAWKNWLQEPGNRNAPARRIIPKSLFITPYICSSGQRLDQKGCVHVVSVNKHEHEQNLLEQLNALFTISPKPDITYDYDDEPPGPLQLSIPIGMDPQASPLHSEPSTQTQEMQPTHINIDKKGENKVNSDLSLETELELLKLEEPYKLPNDKATTAHQHGLYTNNLLSYPDKPKRDSPAINETNVNSQNKSIVEIGQKELVYGDVSNDSIMYNGELENKLTQNINNTSEQSNDKQTTDNTFDLSTQKTESVTENELDVTKITNTNSSHVTYDTKNSSGLEPLKNNTYENKINPGTEYSNIGETIKLISKYAEVTTDDNFSKERNKVIHDDSVLGTRVKPQYRQKTTIKPTSRPDIKPKDIVVDFSNTYPKSSVYYRYPPSSLNPPMPPPNYPFKHLQDYWPGQIHYGGVYNKAHENPTRHHHTYPQNYFWPRNYASPYVSYQRQYPPPQRYPRHLESYQQRSLPNLNVRSPRSTDQSLYSLLGLRHWFTEEGTSNR